MMRAQLDDAHERGEPIAALWASEATIYGRFGYGLASFSGDIALPRERTRVRAPFEPRGRVRLVERTRRSSCSRRCRRRLRRQRPGMFLRSREWWEDRRAARRPAAALRRRPEAPRAARARRRAGRLRDLPHRAGFEDCVNAGHVEVVEAIGVDAGGDRRDLALPARRRLGRRRSGEPPAARPSAAAPARRAATDAASA